MSALKQVAKGLSVPSRKDVQKAAEQSKVVGQDKPPKRIGRPPGKRTNPEYTQVGAWIRKSTYDRVRIALIQQDNREFSELVEDLLQDWLNRQD